jgi:hypothetical protein
MNHPENRTIGQCHQRAFSKVMIAIAIIAFSWLSACPEKSHAQRVVANRASVGPEAEKPLPSGSAANAPKIIDVTEVENGYADIHFRNFAADVSRITLERQLVTKIGNGAWFEVWGMSIHDHRKKFNPYVRNHKRQPGATYVYHESAGLTPGDKYRYRVRAIQPYKPQPVVLLSAVRTIMVKPHGNPTPTDPTPSTVVTKTIYLKARPLHTYVAITQIPGQITEIEIPEVNGETLRIHFAKPGYRIFEYATNPDATVMLTSGQTSTPSQISELFGTGQKKLHVKFVAFVRALQGKEPKSVAIRVSYAQDN